VAGRGGTDQDTHAAEPGPHCTHAAGHSGAAAVLELGPPLVTRRPWRKPYLRALRQTGTQRAAAAVAGVPVRTVQHARQRSPRFRAACERVLGVYLAEQAAAIREAATLGARDTTVKVQKDRDGNEVGREETTRRRQSVGAALRAAARLDPSWAPQSNHRHSHTHRAALDRPGARASLASQRSAALPITYADHPRPDHPTPPTNGAPGVCPGVDGCGSSAAVDSGPSGGDASATTDEFDGVGCS
jgi:hypothetical protein